MLYLGSLEPSPVGPLLILSDEKGVLRRIEFWGSQSPSNIGPELEAQGHQFGESRDAIAHVITQLNQYFAKEREEFELQLEPEGTDFQRLVWSCLREIPYGICRSYGQIAEAAGNPKAVRAVGSANNKNPIPIVIPCHRVIGSDGSMVGYGGGLEIKHQLLVHEGYLLI